MVKRLVVDRLRADDITWLGQKNYVCVRRRQSGQLVEPRHPLSFRIRLPPLTPRIRPLHRPNLGDAVPSHNIK